MLQKNITLDLHDDHSAHHHPESHSVFGFWLYLMTDCIIFATLFAVFAVMSHQFAGGPTAKDLFEIKGVEIETAILLVGSITFGFGMLGAHRGNRQALLFWLAVTFLLGLAFIGLEIREFSNLVAQGNGPDRSAFLSSFFTLVATHGLHVSLGLIWMVILACQVLAKGELTEKALRRLTCLSLFWHFLDVV